tara:strand:- start:715 stop:1239 length:525 start_codon:yes stop_codon:yes gene_type:complete
MERLRDFSLQDINFFIRKKIKMKRSIIAVAVSVSMSTVALADNNGNENLVMNEGSVTTTQVTNKDSARTAYAPSVQVGGADMCRSGVGAGGQTSALGLSFGTTVVDENCERLKLAREIAIVLDDKETAKAILCQDERVARAYASVGKACHVDVMKPAKVAKVSVKTKPTPLGNR